MSENCSGNCSSCGENCGERKQESLLAELNERSKVKKVIAVVSGKGGVGKSTVTAMLAAAVQRRGLRAAILDADITGPSIPKAFGVEECADAEEACLHPAVSKTGVQIMSINLLLDNASDPVLWRGPIIAGAVKQFWTDVVWENVDYLFVDMPPGTGDVPLTVFQSLPIQGIIVVTTPQELVGMIVEKAVRMAEMMKVPVLGLVENMSYFQCPDCGKQHAIFGPSRVEETAKKYGIPFTARLPIDPAITAAVDAGQAESIHAPGLDDLLNGILNARE